MRDALSLRLRLTLIILCPLLVIATATGFWQLQNARQTATEVFDRSLLSAALAVSNDVAFSGGDALSPRTNRILADTSGGRVFYHVYAPDGVIVAGYATPPVGIPRPDAQMTGPTFFKARYRGREVSGVRLQNRTQIDGISGLFTTTVWQDISVRTAFVRDLVMRSFIVISGLIACVGLVVWFGVRVGLRPLLDLEDAIDRRSSDDLAAIKRSVPPEVRGIVDTLNSLFAQVSRTMTAQSEFISNAAHQLRNPIAGLLSLAEAVNKAPDADAMKARSADLLQAAKETAELTQRLLTLERAKSLSSQEHKQEIDLAAAMRDWLPGLQAAAEPTELSLTVEDDLGALLCDPTLLREALINLVDNAVRHGGAELSRIDVSARRKDNLIRVSIADNGRGMKANDIPRALERFSQLSPASGSGLGLPIATAIAEAHGGALTLTPLHRGLDVTLTVERT